MIAETAIGVSQLGRTARLAERALEVLVVLKSAGKDRFILPRQ